MFTDEDLNALIRALDSKIIDDVHHIEFWEKEIKHNKSDKKYLEDSKNILKRDIDLMDRIHDELYSRKYKK